MQGTVSKQKSMMQKACSGVYALRSWLCSVSEVSSAPSIEKSTPSWATKISLAANAPISAELTRQSKPSGLSTTASPLPIRPAIEYCSFSDCISPLNAETCSVFSSCVSFFDSSTCAIFASKSVENSFFSGKVVITNITIDASRMIVAAFCR